MAAFHLLESTIVTTTRINVCVCARARARVFVCLCDKTEMLHKTDGIKQDGCYALN